MAPTRILHLYETCGPGGAEKMILDLVRGLPPNQYESTVVLLVEGWLTQRLREIGVEPIHPPRRGAFDPRTVLDLLRTVRSRGIQLIHSHEFFTNVLGCMVAKLANLPVITTVHGKSYYTDRGRRRLAYRAVARCADCFVTVSDDLKTFLAGALGIPPSRMTTVHNGVDPGQYLAADGHADKRAELGLPPDAVVLGAVGSLYPVKGHTYLLQALTRILPVHPQVTVVLVGRGDLRAELEAEVRTSGLQDHVRFLGFRPDVTDLLATFDIFVLPSVSEGLPLSLLEAMAMAKPVVASAVGGIPEVVLPGRTGLLVPPADPRALAEAILSLLDNAPLAKQIGQQARDHVAGHFTLARMLERYQTLYRACLGHSHA